MGTVDESLSSMMRYLRSRYLQYVNHVYRRSYTHWKGAYKKSIGLRPHFVLNLNYKIENLLTGIDRSAAVMDGYFDRGV
jgi:hypothetical protein